MWIKKYLVSGVFLIFFRNVCILNELFDFISDNELCIFENKICVYESYLSNSNWCDFLIYRFIIKWFIKD